MEKNTCQNCGYYRQHYVWLEEKFTDVGLGHCVHPPRNRNCRPWMAACPKWIPQDERYFALHLPPK